MGKSVQRCVALAQLLVEQNFPAIAIHRGMTQSERLSRYQQFKDFQKRILVATNLFGRGMDIERVNIVFNYDMPEDTDTYLHRVARAGRFGTKGLAITFVSDETDAKILNEVQDRFEVTSRSCRIRSTCPPTSRDAEYKTIIHACIHKEEKIWLLFPPPTTLTSLHFDLLKKNCQKPISLSVAPLPKEQVFCHE